MLAFLHCGYTQIVWFEWIFFCLLYFCQFIVDFIYLFYVLLFIYLLFFSIHKDICSVLVSFFPKVVMFSVLVNVCEAGRTILSRPKAVWQYS